MARIKHWAQPAAGVIDKLGGITRTAEIVGCSPNWVVRWRIPKERGGTGGAIPKIAQIEILKAVDRCEIVAIRASDMTAPEADAPSRPSPAGGSPAHPKETSQCPT